MCDPSTPEPAGGYARFRVTLTMDYQLPNDLNERLKAYGVTEPAECFQVDLEVDPFALLEDGNLEVLRVEASRG